MQIESSRFEQMGAIATAIAEDTISHPVMLSTKPTIFYPNNNKQCIRVGAELKTAHIVQPRETFSDNGRIEANQGSNAACVDAVLSLKRGTMDTTLLSSSVLLSRSVFLTLLFSVFCMMSIVADGLDIVDVGEDGWKVGAVKMLQGAVVKGGGGGTIVCIANLHTSQLCLHSVDMLPVCCEYHTTTVSHHNQSPQSATTVSHHRPSLVLSGIAPVSLTCTWWRTFV